MKFSNLWEDKFVHQVQVVAYYHQWKDEAHVRGGQFALWTDTGEPHMVNPDSGTASIVDGSKNVHTATVYWPDHPAGPPPVIDKEKDVFLAFRDQSKVDDDEGELTWDVIQDGKILRSYNESEIRFSLVYVRNNQLHLLSCTLFCALHLYVSLTRLVVLLLSVVPDIELDVSITLTRSTSTTKLLMAQHQKMRLWNWRTFFNAFRKTWSVVEAGKVHCRRPTTLQGD